MEDLVFSRISEVGNVWSCQWFALLIKSGKRVWVIIAPGP